MSELWRALACYAESPGPRHGELSAALDLEVPDAWQHTDCFTFRFYPYASVYTNLDGMLGGETRDRIAGFWRALGRTPPTEPDSLAVMLAFHAALIDAEQSAGTTHHREAWRRARATHFHEHLDTWLQLLLGRMIDAGGPFAAWASLLDELCREERRELGPAPGIPPHLELAPAFDGRALGLDELLRMLLAPVRSSLIVVRSDLVEIARELGLATRAGERRFLLEALLAQDTPGTLRSLADRARASAAQLDAQARAGWQPMGNWWARRAEITARELSRLASMASSRLASSDAPASMHDHGRASL